MVIICPRNELRSSKSAVFLLIVFLGCLSFPYILLKSFYNEGDSKILPLCTRGILDKRSYEYSLDSLNMARKPIQDPPCKLIYYEAHKTIQCFDYLLNYGLLKEPQQQIEGDPGDIILAFMGDSRIRQLYFESFKVFPFLEDSWHNPVRHWHGDMKTSIDILNNNVSFAFYWKPYLINMIQTIEEWADPNKTKVIPHFLLLGASAWYMIAISDFDHLTFERHLRDLWPLLERLSRRMKERSNGKIVWMMQYPKLDQSPIIQAVDHNDVKVNSEKLEHYNSITRHILRNSSVVQVWDSWIPIKEEYDRACMALFRSAPFELRTWKDCNDHMHAGYVATTQAFQFLLNDLCNAYITIDE